MFQGLKIDEPYRMSADVGNFVLILGGITYLSGNSPKKSEASYA